MRTKEQRAKWKEAHREEIRIANAEYYRRNKDKIKAWHQRPENKAKHKERVRRWTEENRELAKAKARQKARLFNARHPGRNTAASSQYKAAKRGTVPRWANKFFMEEAYRLARLRTKMTGFKWEVDHIVPLRSAMVCGLHCEQNLRVIPKSENCSKGNRTWPNKPGEETAAGRTPALL